MVILNQVVGVGGFSIESNLRLIVIAAIFIGIIVVLLCIKFARSGEKTNGKNISKAKTGEDIEEIAESAEGTEGEPVSNIETIEEKIKNSEAEIITKFAAVIKDVRAKTDTKLTAETENLISKIEEREKEVVNKIESVIDAKVQEALNKMNDRVDAALRTQKSSTASVLEKLVDSLRTEEAPAGSLTSGKAETTVEKKVGFEKSEERESEAPVKDQGALGDLSMTLQMKEELAVPSEDKTDIKLEEKVSEGNLGDTADFDMQEFLDEEAVGVSSSGKSNVAVEEDVMPEEIKEEELETLSEGKANVKLEAEEPIASPGGNKEKVSEETVGDAVDFDMQEFLNEEPVGIPSSDESNVVVEEDVVPEEVKKEELEEPSEDNANAELDRKVSGETAGDSADFDIQEFLDELENLPSENDSEAEK